MSLHGQTNPSSGDGEQPPAASGGRRIAAVLVLALMILPSGLCSLVFTPSGLMMIFAKDSVANAAGIAMLIGSTVGWIFCGLMILLYRRLRRGPPTEAPR